MTLHDDLENINIFILLPPDQVTSGYRRLPGWLIYSTPFELRGSSGWRSNSSVFWKTDGREREREGETDQGLLKFLLRSIRAT